MCGGAEGEETVIGIDYMKKKVFPIREKKPLTGGSTLLSILY